MNNFYVTLLSNAGKDDFIGDFKSLMPNTIHLGSAYEVALTSIIYPGTHTLLTNAKESNGQLLENEIKIGYGDSTYVVSVPPASFSSGQELVNLLNYSINRAITLTTNDITKNDIILFTFNNITNRCIVEKVDQIHFVHFSRRIAYLLGCPIEITSFPHTAEYITNSGTDLMYVYLNNLIEPQIHSHARVPVIKVLSIPPGNGSNVEIDFSKPHYVPVRAYEFDHIAVQLKNDRNQIIPFTSGKVAMVLHFRKNKSLFLNDIY